MRINEKQLHVLIRVLEGSLTISDRSDMNLFGFDRETRFNIYKQIVNQLSEDLIEIKDNIGDNSDAVTTYGKTISDCENAAEGGNAIKKLLGWPEELCNAKPKRSKNKGNDELK